MRTLALVMVPSTFWPWRLGVLASLALLVCACSARKPVQPPAGDAAGPGMADSAPWPVDRSVIDQRPPPRDRGRDKMPWKPDRRRDSGPDARLAGTIVVTSDKVVVNPFGYPQQYVRWGTDHVYAGDIMYRISSAGKLLAKQPVPKMSTNPTEPVTVVAMAAGSKGLGVMYMDEFDLRLALLDKSLKFPKKTEMISAQIGRALQRVKMLPWKTGFSFAYGKLKNKPATMLGFADAAGKLSGTPAKASDHMMRHFHRDETADFSAFVDPFYGLRHVSLKATPGAKATLGPKLISKPRHLGGGSEVYYATAPTGERWVGFGDIVQPGTKFVLMYNVEKNSKALFSKEQTFTKPTDKTQRFCDVGTDGKRFLAIWGEAKAASSTPDKTFWKGRLFDLNGAALGPAQDLNLTPSIVLMWHNLTEGKLIWTGKDFVLFFVQQYLYGGALRMARLSITP